MKLLSDSLQNISCVHENPNIVFFQSKNNQFSPDINKDDYIFVDRSDKNFTDGYIYVFSDRLKASDEIIRRVIYTLSGKMKLTTPSDSEEITRKEWENRYECLGRAVKRVALINEEL